MLELWEKQRFYLVRLRIRRECLKIVGVWVSGRSSNRTFWKPVWSLTRSASMLGRHHWLAGFSPYLSPSHSFPPISQTHRGWGVSICADIGARRATWDWQIGVMMGSYFSSSPKWAGFVCLVSASNTSKPRGGFPVISSHQRAWSLERRVKMKPQLSVWLRDKAMWNCQRKYHVPLESCKFLWL